MHLLLLLGLVVAATKLLLSVEGKAVKSRASHSKNVTKPVKCDVIMRYVHGYGIGLYAGKKFKKGAEVEHSVGFAAPRYVTLWNELDQYVEAYNDTHHLLSGGHYNLFNHAPKHLMLITKARKTGRWIHYDGSASVDTASVAVSSIKPGDQIFSFYDSDWFALRNIQEINPLDLVDSSPDIIHVDNIHSSPGRIPGCSTKLTKIRKYRDPDTGRSATELVARRNITRGSVIEVTRALLLSEGTFLEPEPLNSFLWWKKGYSHRKYDPRDRDRSNVRVVNTPYNHTDNYAVLQSGNGGLYHAYRRGPSEVNVDYDWWDLSAIGVPSESLFWHSVSRGDESSIADLKNADNNVATNKTGNKQRTLQQEISVEGASEIEAAVSTAESFVAGEVDEQSPALRRTKNGHICCTRMLISFTARRDIAKGERLVVDLKTMRSSPGKRFVTASFAQQCL